MKYQDLDRRDPREQDTYQTGSTNPPKSHSDLIAFLLIAVIFLAGLTSILGIMNVRLFSALNAQNEGTIPMALYADGDAVSVNTEKTGDLTEQTANDSLCMGICCEPVLAVYQSYYSLPAGMFINRVVDGSSAETAGVEAGDILISLDGAAVTTNEELTGFLKNRHAGDRVEAVIYRNKTQFNVTLTVENADQ